MTPILKKLLEIQEQQSFDDLDQFQAAFKIEEFTLEEKALLARLLTKYGIQHLEKGDSRVISFFEQARQVCPSLSIYLEQGSALANYSENVRCLIWAHEAFLLAIEKDPQCLSAWYLDAQILVKKGLFEENLNYFLEADQKFQKVAQLILNQEMPSSFVEHDFYWYWGSCLFALGRYSGEPCDFNRAVTYYQMAEKLGCKDERFLNDFGHALIDLSGLINRKDLYLQAINLFSQAIQQSPEQFEGWFNQACCLQRLAEVTGDEAIIDKAYISFERAASLQPTHSIVWLKWGQLEGLAGKLKYDEAKVADSLKKLEEAYNLDPEQPAALSYWGEMELFLGVQQDNLELIQAAKLKIVKSLELQPDNPEGWYLYGSCLTELGQYFDDEYFYQQAIEKFYYGLSLVSTYPLLWYGLAFTHFALGELSLDVTHLERAVQCCSKVIECGGVAFPQFWNDWAISLMKLGEMTGQVSYIEAAVEKFEYTLKLFATDSIDEEMNLDWLYHYGCALDLLGDLTDQARHFEKAIQVLNQVLQIDTHHVHARYNLALALFHLADMTSDIENYEKAIEQFRLVLESDTEDEAAHMDLGIALVHLALLIEDPHHTDRAHLLYREAEFHLMQSASLGNCQVYYQLAGLYALVSQFSLAMQFIERAQVADMLPSIEEIMHDEWLEKLRDTPEFRYFLSQLSNP